MSRDIEERMRARSVYLLIMSRNCRVMRHSSDPASNENRCGAVEEARHWPRDDEKRGRAASISGSGWGTGGNFRRRPIRIPFRNLCRNAVPTEDTRQGGGGGVAFLFFRTAKHHPPRDECSEDLSEGHNRVPQGLR